MNRKWLVAFAALSAITAGSSRSRAQAARDPAAAEALFVEGKAAAQAGDYATACARYAESHRLDPGVGILLYLGDCNEKLGRLASAWAAYREAEEAARARGQADREARAAERAKAIEPKLPRLAVFVPADARVPGLSIRRGDVVLGEGLWGTKLPVDPGKHLVEATAPGREPFRVEVEARAAEVAEVTIPALAEPAPQRAPAAAPPPAPPPARPPPADAGSGRRTAGLVVGGVGLGVVAFGAVSGLVAASAWSEALDHCEEGTKPLRCDSTGVAAADRTDVWGTTSTIAIALGAAGVGAGIVLFATAPADDELSVGAALGPTEAAVSAFGRF
jgi:hypothetical protein